MLPAPIPTDLFVPLANVCKSCARHVGKLHHGSSPHRRCPPCELTRSRFASCLRRQQHVRRLHATRRMGLKLCLPSSEKAFGAERFSKIPFSVTTAATNARACGPPMCPLWSLPLSKLAPQIEHVTLGILCLQRSTESPAVTQSAGSFHDLFVAKATCGSQVLRPVRGATEDSGPRDEHVSADLSRCRHAMSARHLCRRSASGSALTTRFSTRWARLSLRKRSARWAPSFARWCHICLEQRARVLFGTTTTKSHGVPTAGPSPSTVPAKD